MILLYLLRFFLSFILVFILEPQTPQSNSIIIQIRSTNFFKTYKGAKITFHRLTWSVILLFYILTLK